MMDDGKRLTADEFVKRLQSQPLVDHPLERRLTELQSFGLADNLRRQLTFLGPHGSVLEIQTLGHRRFATDNFPKTRAAHATSGEEVVRLCVESDEWLAQGTYLLLAHLKEGVETRHCSPGQWFDIPKAGGTTDSDVESRLVLAIDFDVMRPTGTSATDDELKKAIQAALQAWQYLTGAFGTNACMAYVHSGNGRQIHLALDSLPNDEKHKILMAGLLVGLDTLLSTSHVKIDRKLFDAKRILPACGTVKKKGSAGVESRPHRRTAIVTPDVVQRLSYEHLHDLAHKIWNDTNDEGRAAMNAAFGIRETVSPISPPRDSPFGAANAVPPDDVAQWLNLYDGQDVRCPGCGETGGVAVLQYGLKCHHNRCSDKGRNGFRTNVDLVAEVHNVTPKDAVLLLAERFTFDISGLGTFEPGPPSSLQKPTFQSPEPATLSRLNEILISAIDRAQRRADDVEKSIPLPWPSLKSHYGGGLWPGVHFICSGTGVGKTAAALQIGLCAAEKGIAVGYVGLEMEAMQIALRLIGEHGGMPWSTLYTGQANQEMLNMARASALSLIEKNLPFHPLFARPQGWPASELKRTAEAMRKEYPEPEGAGSRPLLLILDFLQIVGDESGQELDLRTRISRASYIARHIASEMNMVVLVISSIARDKYQVIANAATQSGLTFDMDATGAPINRKIKNPDALVGLGKESGDIEFSADSVSAIARMPDSDDMLWITAKGRATGASWSPMRFTGFRYEEPMDGGRGLAASMSGVALKKEEVKATAEKEKLSKTTQDSVEIARAILESEDGVCGVRELRTLLSDSSARWKEVKDLLGPSMVQTKGKGKGAKDSVSISVPNLPAIVRGVLVGLGVNFSSYRGSVDPHLKSTPVDGGCGSVDGIDPKGSFLHTPHPHFGSTVESEKTRSTVADVKLLEEMCDIFRQQQALGIDPRAWADERAPDMGWTSKDIQTGAWAVQASSLQETLASDPGGGALIEILVKLVEAKPNITRASLDRLTGIDTELVIDAALAQGLIQIIGISGMRTFVVKKS
jgi:hypothetical protein